MCVCVRLKVQGVYVMVWCHEKLAHHHALPWVFIIPFPFKHASLLPSLPHLFTCWKNRSSAVGSEFARTSCVCVNSHLRRTIWLLWLSLPEYFSTYSLWGKSLLSSLRSSKKINSSCNLLLKKIPYNSEVLIFCLCCYFLVSPNSVINTQTYSTHKNHAPCFQTMQRISWPQDPVWFQLLQPAPKQ